MRHMSLFPNTGIFFKNKKNKVKRKVRKRSVCIQGNKNKKQSLSSTGLAEKKSKNDSANETKSPPSFAKYHELLMKIQW